jgi:hypothetical protein
MHQPMIKNQFKTKTVRELGAININAIVNDVASIPAHVWEEQNKEKPNNFYEFYHTQHIVFRFVHELNDCSRSFEFPIWALWKDKIQPLLDQAVQPYGYAEGRFSRIMLAKLTAGGNIKAHKDGNEAATFPHKIHIPIVTNPKALFFVNPKTFHMEAGKAYEVNNLAVHYAENTGTEDRIHLIFEYFDGGHLKAQNIHQTSLDNSIIE